MKKITFFILILITVLYDCQNKILSNKTLIDYYTIISNAERNIVDNKLDSANIQYNTAFKIWNQPHGKDLYNSMIVALKLKDKKFAENTFQRLICLEYNFSDDFFVKYPALKNIKRQDCNLKIDYAYKKTLDSLFVLDQHYRLLSNRDYKKFQKEITKSDSITSTRLLKLIEEKGFPNEYNIGLNSVSKDSFFHKFYYIIWHQLKTNIFSPQVVNFSDELSKALNAGKINPDNFAFLSDLNNGSNRYDSPYFDINSFAKNTNDASGIQPGINNIEENDCCYVHQWFFPKNRNDKGRDIVAEINVNRKEIGLSSLDQLLLTRLFYLNNKDYFFPEVKFKIHQFSKQSDVDFFKKHFIKIK